MKYDLRGPAGNVFAIMGAVQHWGRQMDMSRDDIDAIIAEMRGGDYNNALAVVRKHFPVVEFIGHPSGDPDEEDAA